MSSLRRLLQQLLEEVEKITDKAPPGPGELDVSRLDDDELARLERLLGQVGSSKPRRETRPRDRVLAGKARPATWNRHWVQNPGAAPPPEITVRGRLSERDVEELCGLLQKAQVPDNWQEERGG